MLQPQKRPQSFSFLHMGWIIIRGSFSDNFFGEYLQELGGKNYQKRVKQQEVGCNKEK